MGSAKKKIVKSGRSVSSKPAKRVAKKAVKAVKRRAVKEKIGRPNTPALGSDLGMSAMHNEFYTARKQLLTLRVDADVLAYFRGTGEGYQAKMNEWLRVAMLESVSRAKDNLPEVDPFRGESPALAESAFFKSRKVQLSLRLDADVVGFYKAKGKGYQTLMNKHLRLAMLELTESARGGKR